MDRGKSQECLVDREVSSTAALQLTVFRSHAEFPDTNYPVGVFPPPISGRKQAQLRPAKRLVVIRSEQSQRRRLPGGRTDGNRDSAVKWQW